MVIKGQFIMSTKEIHQEIVAAEEETMCKKAQRKQPTTGVPERGRKRKRPETPSEGEEESFRTSHNDSGDCITVANC